MESEGRKTRTHHRHPLEAEPSPVAKVPPRLDLLNDEHAFEADAVRPLLVVSWLIRHRVAWLEGRAEVGGAVRDADLRFVHGEILAQAVTRTVAAASEHEARGQPKPASRSKLEETD